MSPAAKGGSNGERSLAALSGLFAAASLIIAVINRSLNTAVPEGYMDEIFHIPQTQRYCAGDFKHWDNMITTFPGLYLLAVPWSWLLTSCGVSSPCGPAALRALNAALGVATLLVLVRIISRQEPSSTGVSKAVALWLFPPSFFCIFLYYTDTSSLLFVLLCYDYSSRDLDWSAGVAAVAAVGVRQTNVVWVTYIAGLRMLARAPPHTTLPSLAGHLSAPRTLIAVLPLLAVIAAFAVFLVANGGTVVVGDAGAHGFSFHGAQLLYFGAINLCAGFPSSVAASTARWPMWSHLVAAAALTTLSTVLVLRGTIVHKYLLADNRHYPFYIWKKFLGRGWWARYVPVPVYALGLYSTAIGVYGADRSGSHSSSPTLKLLRAFGLLVAVSLVLIPSPLLEPRYFITPFVMAQLQAPSSASRLNLAQIGLFGVVNAVTLYVFIARPFVGPDGAEARFMW